MRFEEFDTKMRKFEWIGEARVPEDAYIILRIDGKGFSKFTERAKFDKPFDWDLHNLMLESAKSVLTTFEGVYAYTESDEISVLLPKEFNLYNREVAKLVSISAALASSAFTAQFIESCMLNFKEREGFMSLGPIAFDSRIWCSEQKERVMDYFNWRMADAKRCALNSATYWALRNAGNSKGKATSLMSKATNDWKKEVYKAKEGVDFDSLPMWQRLGTGIYNETYYKKGFNPKTNEETLVTRRRLKVDENLTSPALQRVIVETALINGIVADEVVLDEFNKGEVK